MAAKKTTTARKSTSSKRSTTKKKQAASPRGRSSAAKTKGRSGTAGSEEVTIDRRRQADRRADEDNENSTAPAPKLERRSKVQRRRQIDPTTCERDYSDDEVEFMNALDEYKRKSGRMFPTCSEVLEVIRGLGYVKLSPGEMAQVSTPDNEASEGESQPLSDEHLDVELSVEEPVLSGAASNGAHL